MFLVRRLLKPSNTSILKQTQELLLIWYRIFWGI